MIISISGRIGHGKDEVAKIIQYLTSRGSKGSYASFSLADSTSSWHIKKFADKLKDITCLLLGCTREQLEDREFKEKELGEEWWYWDIDKYPNLPDNCLKLTPRKLLQLLGTECGRLILHLNIWVNALMSEYNAVDFDYKEIVDKEIQGNWIYPNWIITDTRFPNELEAIKTRSGVCIKVVRDSIPTPLNEHESETALDAASFDYMINNNGSLEDLVESVRQILLDLNIISK